MCYTITNLLLFCFEATRKRWNFKKENLNTVNRRKNHEFFILLDGGLIQGEGGGVGYLKDYSRYQEDIN